MVVPNRWSVAFVGAAILALAFASGCSTPPSPAFEQARLRTLRAELIARGDPDSLATAAFFQRFATGQWHDAPDLAARATAAAPDRADLAYLQLLLCYQTPSCKAEPLETHLRDLDPANGITWIYALGRAIRANDAAGTSAALAGLARAQRVDLYWTALVSHMTTAVTGRAGFDESGALVFVIGVDAAMVLPPLQPISTSCSASAIANQDVLAQCRRIFAALEHADTVLIESYGNRRAARLWPDGSAESMAIAAQRRILDYHMNLWVERPRTLNSRKATRTLAGLLGQYSTEQEAYLALYADLGLQPDPPADWKLPQPHG
jgi:hypothetical protein